MRVKLWRNKHKNSESTQSKMSLYTQENIIPKFSDFSLKPQRPGNGRTISLKCWGKKKKKNPCQPRILYPDKLTFQNKSEIKTFSEKRKWRVSLSSGPALQEVPVEVLQANVGLRKASSVVCCMGGKLTQRVEAWVHWYRPDPGWMSPGRCHFECDVAMLFICWTLDPEPPAHFWETCAKAWGGS